MLLVGFVNRFKSFTHYSSDDFFLVDLFDGLCLFEDTFGSFPNMIFQSNLLRNEEVKKSVISDTEIFIMDEFIFDLGFCDCHQVSSSSFCVLIVETLDIGRFHCSDSPIKSIQKRHHE